MKSHMTLHLAANWGRL